MRRASALEMKTRADITAELLELAESEKSLLRQSQIAAAIIESERKPPRRCPRPCRGEREWTTGTRYNCVCRKCGRYFKVKGKT